MARDKDDDQTQWMGEPGNKTDDDKTVLAKDGISLDTDKTEKISLDGPGNLDWNPGDVVLDLYEIKEVFTTGGMGLVYHVHHRTWDIDLIIKSPRAEIIAQAGGTESFATEAETWVDLGLHPNIVTCHYVRTIDGIPMVFAEYVDGGSLKDWIARGDLYKDGPEASLERVLDVSMQFAWGLHYAHQRGLVHRDVKPANVLMTKEGTVKVTDFGLAKAKIAVVGSDDATSYMELDSSAPGGQQTKALMTPAYCSPEQAERAALAAQETPTAKLPELTPATDIWSFALSVMEMFIGGLTWTTGLAGPMVLEDYLGAGSAEVWGKPSEPEQEDGQEPLHEGLPHMPEELASLLKKCLELKPSNRPQTMERVIQELEQIYHQQLGRPYFRETPDTTSLRADGLNNKALSMLDLGNALKAEQLLEQALKIDPNHADATFNLIILQWRRGMIDDLEVLDKLELKRKLSQIRMPWDEMIARVHMERGDFTKARETLANLPSSTETMTLQRIAQSKTNMLGKVMEHKTGINRITAVELSKDKKKLIVGSEKRNECPASLIIWNFETNDLSIIDDGQESSIRSVAYHPSGKFIVVGYEDGKVRNWNFDSGQIVSEYLHPSYDTAGINPVTSVTCSSDGKKILSAYGNAFYLWELDTKKIIQSIPVAERKAVSALFNSDEKTVITKSFTGAVREYEIESYIQWWDVVNLKSLSGIIYGSNIQSIDFTTDESWILTAGDRFTALHNIHSAILFRNYGLESPQSRIACFSLTGKTIFEARSKYGDTELLNYEAETGRCRHTTKLTYLMKPIAWLPRNEMVLLQEFTVEGSGISINLFQFDESSYVNSPLRISTPQVSEKSIKFEKEYHNLIGRAAVNIQDGCFDSAIHNIQSARELPGYEMDEELIRLWQSLSVHCSRRTIRSIRNIRQIKTNGIVVISPDGKSLGVRKEKAENDRRIWLTDLGEGMESRELEAHQLPVIDFVFHPYGKAFLTASWDKTLRLWDSKNLTNIRTYIGHKDRITSVAFGFEGECILTGGDHKTTILWDTLSGIPKRAINSHYEVDAVAISPNGWLFATAGADGPWTSNKGYSIRFWDAKTGNCLKIIKQNEHVLSMCFSTNGINLLVGSADNNAYLYDAFSGELRHTLAGHTNEVSCVAMDSNSAFAVTGSDDRTVRIWDLKRIKCLFVMDRHKSEVEKVMFSNDCQHIVSSGRKGDTVIMELDWDLLGQAEKDWDESARRLLELFIERHTSHSEGIFHKNTEKPIWTEDDFQFLMDTLGRAGFGYLRPEGVRQKLDELCNMLSK